MPDSNYENNSDAVDAEEMYTDTSMFNAEEIVKQIEEAASQRNGAHTEQVLDARRRAEILREQRRLKEDLDDFDDYSFDD